MSDLSAQFSAITQAEVQSKVGYAVARKMLDAQAGAGEAAVKMIEAAAGAQGELVKAVAAAGGVGGVGGCLDCEA